MYLPVAEMTGLHKKRNPRNPSKGTKAIQRNPNCRKRNTWLINEIQSAKSELHLKPRYFTQSLKI